jgi:hypothetical protein
MSSPPVFKGVRVTQSLVLCVCFVDRCLSFVHFPMAIVFSVLRRYTNSDYPIDIFKLVLSSDNTTKDRIHWNANLILINYFQWCTSIKVTEVN